MLPILGYKPNDLLEKSLYEYHHGADSGMLMNAFKNGKLSTVYIIFPELVDYLLFISKKTCYPITFPYGRGNVNHSPT